MKNTKNLDQRSWPSCREWNPRPKAYQALLLTIHSVSTNNIPVSAVNNVKVPEACKIAKPDVNINLLHVFSLKNGRFKRHLCCLHRSIIGSLVALQSWSCHLGSIFFKDCTEEHAVNIRQYYTYIHIAYHHQGARIRTPWWWYAMCYRNM